MHTENSEIHNINLFDKNANAKLQRRHRH